MNMDYFSKMDPQYPEYGIIMEDCKSGGVAKVYIPVLMPEISNTILIESNFPRASVGNIANKAGREGIESYTETNFLNIKSPSYIGELKKGNKVILVFVGGDINKPKIVGLDE